MSTDDLVRRARAEADRPHSADPALAELVSELADEVDQLRGKRVLALANEDYWLAQHEARRREIDGLVTERDAARAALERVRALTAEWHVAQAANQAALARGERLPGLRLLTPRNIPLPDDYDRALEGES